MPYQNPTLPDTLIVDGTDLQSLAGVWMGDFGFLLAGGLRRADPETIPRRQGRRGTAGVYDSFPFTVPVIVTCHDMSLVEPATELGQRAQYLDNLRGLAAAIKGTEGVVALTRRLTNDASGTYDTDTAAGEFVTGLTPNGNETSPFRGEFDLQFINLDGAWTPDSGTTWLVP